MVEFHGCALQQLLQLWWLEDKSSHIRWEMDWNGLFSRCEKEGFLIMLGMEPSRFHIVLEVFFFEASGRQKNGWKAEAPYESEIESIQ